MIAIREIRADDAVNFLTLCRSLDDETRHMMYELGERTTTAEQQRANIVDVLASPNSVIIVADTGAELVGYVAATGGQFNRIRHSAYVVAGVRKAFGGQGIGTRLFEALDCWAGRSGVRRLELTVRVDNAAAIRLYRRMGFEREGIKRHSLVVDGADVDEMYMAKLAPAAVEID